VGLRVWLMMHRGRACFGLDRLAMLYQFTRSRKGLIFVTLWLGSLLCILMLSERQHRSASTE
jgi:hypothetical protein